MRVASVGSRHYPTMNDVRFYISKLAARKWDGGLMIVSGGIEDGVDAVAFETAEALGLETMIWKPDYDQYGRAAPLVRNGAIVADADLVVAFWDGISPGTHDTIKKALKAHRHTEVIFP